VVVNLGKWKKPRYKLLNRVAVNFGNGLGNFVMLTPTLHGLSRMYNAAIDLVFDDTWRDSRRKSVEELFASCFYGGEIINFTGPSSLDLERYKAIYWTSHGEVNPAWEYMREVATIKASFEDEDDTWRQVKIHEVDFYLKPLIKLGYIKRPTPQLFGFNDVRRVVRKGWKTRRGQVFNGLLPLVIGFCNGFFGEEDSVWSRKAWPYFGELALMLYGFFGDLVDIQLFGKGAQERRWAETVVSMLEAKNYYAKNFVDRLTLPHTIKKMGDVDIFVTTDTGLMHVADAMGIPSVILFGATLASKNGPYTMLRKRLVHSLEGCAPCQNTYHFHLCKDYKCMRSITPADVFPQILALCKSMGFVFPILRGRKWR